MLLEGESENARAFQITQNHCEKTFFSFFEKKCGQNQPPPPTIRVNPSNTTVAILYLLLIIFLKFSFLGPGADYYKYLIGLDCHKSFILFNDQKRTYVYMKDSRQKVFQSFNSVRRVGRNHYNRYNHIFRYYFQIWPSPNLYSLVGRSLMMLLMMF